MSNHYILEMCVINSQALSSKLKISPVGEVTGLDGRVFEIDGQKVVSKLRATGLELVLNIAHSYSGEAAGWFSDYEVKTDGIYATLTLNDNGQELIDKKHYKYLSPEYFKDWDTNEVLMLVGVGLVNQPNLLNDALNHISPTRQNEPENNMPSPAPTLDALQAQVNQLTADNATLEADKATLAKQVHENKVDAAITQGKLAPAKREFALTLDASALDSYLTVESSTFKATENNHLNPDAPDGDESCAIANLYNGTGE